ncbi:MAG TPA: L-dopachrome tautomerase-related protein, partial [Acidobacteriota bacterium]|nr:L-dopachrome tautomerase-related protein [Acidobacteriota bacterium]
PSEKAFLVSSVRKRKVFKISQDGKVSDFLTSGQDGLWGVFGMKVDPKRNRLWLCTSVVREIEGFKAEEDGQAGVFQYDLKTHTLVKKYILPNSEQGHVFGDLELHPKGDVYITDSKSGGLYRISAATDTLERFLDTSPFVSPQGMALTPDGKRMFVADYSVGIGILDLATKTFSLVPATPEMLLLGIDGLYLHQNSLIGMQNGILPKRVIRLDLDTKLSRIEKLSVIERGTQHLEDPTLGVIVNHSIYFIANSQWESFDKDGTMFPPDKLNQHIILKASLK